MKKVSLVLLLLLVIDLSFAISFVPQGDMVGMNRYQILNFTNLTLHNSTFCFNNDCKSAWPVGANDTARVDALNSSVVDLQGDVSNRMLNVTVIDYVSNRLLNATLYDYVGYRMLNTTVTSLLSERLLNVTLYDYVSNRMLNITVETLVGARVLNTTLSNYMPNSSVWDYVGYRMLNTTVTGLTDWLNASKLQNNTNVQFTTMNITSPPVDCSVSGAGYFMTRFTGLSSICTDASDTHSHTSATVTISGENVTAGTIAFARLPGLNNQITLAATNITSGTFAFARLPTLTNQIVSKAENISAGSFGTGNYVFDTNLTAEYYKVEGNSTGIIYGNSTCSLIFKGVTSTVCIK